MKLDKLFRQLRRDVAASPKKAVALGLMVLVALYFWAPMAWGWIARGKDKGKANVAASDVIIEDDPVDPAASAKRERQLFVWEKVRRKLLADPRMSSAMYEASWNDPFRPSGANASTSGVNSSTAAAQAQSDPAKLGLKLTSVAIGPSRRSAVISGRNYVEGELVPVRGKDGQNAGGIEFRLIRVTEYEVELERLGQTYPLELSRPRLAPGDVIRGPLSQ